MNATKSVDVTATSKKNTDTHRTQWRTLNTLKKVIERTNYSEKPIVVQLQTIKIIHRISRVLHNFICG